MVVYTKMSSRSVHVQQGAVVRMFRIIVGNDGFGRTGKLWKKCMNSKAIDRRLKCVRHEFLNVAQLEN